MTKFADPFETYVAPARDRSELWRTILGVILIVAIAALIFVGAYFAVAGIYGFETADRLLSTLENGGGPAGILALLAMFMVFWPAIWIVLRVLHRRRFRTLFGPTGFNLRHFLLGFVVIAGFGIVTLSISLPFFPAELNLNLTTWLKILPIGLVLIFFQAGAEELFFRGYLQQQLAARFQTALIWMVLPSVLFGAGHYSSEFGSNNLLLIIVLSVSGLIAADVTRRTGALSFAFGLHVANNVLAILVLGYELPEGSASLWVDPTPMTDTSAIRFNILITFATTLVMYLVGIYVARRLNRQPRPAQG